LEEKLVFKRDIPVLDHVGKLGDAVSYQLIFVVVRVPHDFPEEICNSLLETLNLRLFSQLA